MSLHSPVTAQPCHSTAGPCHRSAPQWAGRRPPRLRRKRPGRPGRSAGRALRTAAVPGRTARCLTGSPRNKSEARSEAEQPMAPRGRGSSGVGDPGSVGPERRCRPEVARVGARRLLAWGGVGLGIGGSLGWNPRGGVKPVERFWAGFAGLLRG